MRLGNEIGIKKNQKTGNTNCIWRGQGCFFKDVEDSKGCFFKDVEDSNSKMTKFPREKYAESAV